MATPKPKIKLKPDHFPPEWSGKPTKPSTEVAVERNITEIETIDTILTDKLTDINDYRDLLIDDKVIGCWGQRQTALTQLERQVIPHDAENQADVEAAEFIDAQLKRVNFDQIIKAMHYGVYYGRAHGEAMWGIEDGKVVLDNLIVRDRALFKYNADKQLIFTGNSTDEIMPEGKFWNFSAGGDTTDNPYGLGLAHFLFWLVLFKKSNIKFWLLGNEKMATSLPHVQYDPRAVDADGERKKALQAGIALKNGSAIATAQGTTVELLKGVSGTEDYESLCRYMDEAIATVVLGQVMTSQAVGGQYKADVQDGVKDDIIKADADLLCASLNNSIVKWLTAWNFPNAKPPKVWLLTQDEIDQQATSATYANMAKLGYRPTLDTVQETFGGEWELIDSDGGEPAPDALHNETDDDEDSDSADFAEHDHDNPMDDLVDQLADEAAPMTDKWLAELKIELDSVDSLEELRDKLDKLVDKLDFDDYARLFAEANLAARLAGMQAVIDEEAGDG